MALLLHIETSSSLCSVALSEDLRPLAERNAEDSNAHASQLTVLIDELMQECGHTLSQLNAVCLSAGPGSYTGLRIGSSTAKGLCYALEIPLISISTLEIQARMALLHTGAPYACALIDARRMEAYTGIYAAAGGLILEKACELNEEQVRQWADAYPGIVFCGNAVPKIEYLLDMLSLPVHSHKLTASLMIPFTYEKWTLKQFADLALFTPNYIKTWEEGRDQQKKGPGAA